MGTTKKLVTIVLIALIFTSCVTVQQIGQLTMLSNRNIDHSQNYELLKGYVGSTDVERKNSRATTIQEAIDETVQQVPGGEYMMNVRIYLVLKGSKHQYFSTEGDVWGLKQNSSLPPPSGSSYYSFKEGDNVTWKYSSKYYTGVIISMKDRKQCLIKVNETGNTISADYADLSIISNPQQSNALPLGQQNATQSNFQPVAQIKLGDKVVWQDLSNKKFYPGVVVGQGDGTWLIKDDDDSKIYPVKVAQVSLQQNTAPSNSQSNLQIKVGDRVSWQDLSNNKFYPGLVVGQGDGTWLIKDDDDGKIYPVKVAQVYLSK